MYTYGKNIDILLILSVIMKN